jgi:hypothetical protein
MSDFVFYREPRQEQREAFERAKDAEYWAHFWDPRCGKTKEIYDQFVYNFSLGRVTALVVVAYPAKVHLVWVDEAPKDIPPDLYERTRIVAWRSGKMTNRTNVEKLEKLLARDEGPVVLTLNCEALLTPTAWNYLRRFFTRHKVFLVADEDWATSWSARTKRLLAMGRGRTTVMRRWTTGTPVDEGPIDAFYSCQFLKPGCLGFSNMASFRNRYTAYEEEEISPGVFVRKKGYNRRTRTEFDVVKGWCNLDELHRSLSRFSDRVERRGSERVYATRYFAMTDRQRRVYDDLRDRYVAELGDGSAIRAADVLFRMSCLQAVSRNYYPPERIATPCATCAGEGVLIDSADCPDCAGLGAKVERTELRRIDSDRNPAVDAVVEELKFSHRPFVIWAARVQEVADVHAAALTVTPRVARYDGTISSVDRDAAYRAFYNGEIDGIVATEKSSLGRGHDLRRARLIGYYTNEWSLRERRQTEARGDDHDDPDSWTDVVDFVAEDTRDLTAIEALREKRLTSAMILGDPPTAWL